MSDEGEKEDKSNGKKQRRSPPHSWARLKIITTDLMRKAIEAENERRRAGFAAAQTSLREKILGRSRLSKLAAELPGAELNVDFAAGWGYAKNEVAVILTLNGIDGSLQEKVKLDKSEFDKLQHGNLIESFGRTFNLQVDTVAAYASLELQKHPNRDTIEVICKHITHWIKTKG